MANVVEVILRGTDQLTGPFTKAGFNFQKQMLAIGTAASGLAIAAVGALTTLTISAINTADELGHMAQRIGIPVEALSRLAHAAHMSDLSNQQLEVGLKHLAKTIQEAVADPASKGALALKSMGVSATDATGKVLPLEQILLSLSDKFASYRDSLEKTALAQVFFGKSGADMIPFLNESSAGIQRLGKDANVVTDVMARDAMALKDNIDTLKTSIGALGNSIAEAAVGPLSDLAFYLADLARGARQAGDEIAPLTKLINNTAAGLIYAASGARLFWNALNFTQGTQEAIKKMEEIGIQTALAVDRLWNRPRGAITDPNTPPGSTGLGTAPNVNELAAQQEQYAQLLAASQQYLAERARLEERARAERIRKEQAGQQAIIGLTGQMFGTLGRLAATFGAKNFAMQQAFQIGQAIMNTALGVTRAYAEHIYPYSQIVAGIVAALGAAEIAIIAGSKPAGQAHAGMDWVPRTGSYVLEKGEAVIPANQNVNAGSRPLHVTIMFEGQPIYDGITEATRDGRMTIHARAVR